MRKPEATEPSAPAELEIDEDAPSFRRDKKRLGGFYAVDRALAAAFDELREAYRKVRAGESPIDHATQAGFGGSLGGGFYKKRACRDAEGKRGGLRFVYHLDLQNGRATPLVFWSKNERADVPLAEIRKAREEYDSRRARAKG